jgi:hypothetical protein
MIGGDVRRLCLSIRSDAEPLYVDVKPESWAAPSECFPNVGRKVEESGGRIQYGWAIWQCSQFFIEAEHHAVYEGATGEPLIDITPQIPHVDRIIFLPDDSAVYDFVTTDRRDNRRLALLNDSRVHRILELFTARTSLLNEIPSVGGQVEISGERLKRFEAIESEIQLLGSSLMQGQSVNIWKI